MTNVIVMMGITIWVTLNFMRIMTLIMITTMMIDDESDDDRDIQHILIIYKYI